MIESIETTVYLDDAAGQIEQILGTADFVLSAGHQDTIALAGLRGGIGNRTTGAEDVVTTSCIDAVGCHIPGFVMFCMRPAQLRSHGDAGDQNYSNQVSRYHPVTIRDFRSIA